MRKIKWIRSALAGGLLVFLSLMAFRADAQTTYYYTDPQGTVLATADEQGNIIQRFDYRPFGGSISGKNFSGPAYTGHVADADSGLLYMQQRYQDPETGRFLSVDEVGVAPGAIEGFNRYSYASNNPITLIDQDGRQSVNPLWIGSMSTQTVMLANGSEAASRHAAEANLGQAKALAVMAAGAAASPAAGFVARTAVSVATDSVASGSIASAVAANATDVVISGAIIADAAAVANGMPPGAMGPVVAPIASTASEDFFAGTTYTSKVAGQMKLGDMHAFPESVRALQSAGTVKNIGGGDGIVRKMLTIPGEYKGRSGQFEFIKNGDGTINHRLFRPSSE